MSGKIVGQDNQNDTINAAGTPKFPCKHTRIGRPVPAVEHFLHLQGNDLGIKSLELVPTRVRIHSPRLLPLVRAH